jgi:hypothetical protein
MSKEPPDFATAELLRAIGAARAPEPRVLEDAREVLWSAIASEMLGHGSAAAQRTATGEAAAGAEQDRGTARRRPGAGA